MSTPSQPLVAVVTAAHNAERYLAECVTSVIDQTYQHWEYVVLDHGSTDGTSRILANLARRDARIRIVRTPTTLGDVQAINHALREASLDAMFCKVVGSDDWLYPRCLERMVEVGQAHPEVAFVSAYGLEDDYVRGDGLPYPSTVVAGREIARHSLLRDLAVFGTPTSVLWRASVVRSRDPFYDESSLYAHVEACYEALKEADFGFVHEVLTRTRRDYTRFANASFADVVGRLVCLDRYAPVFVTTGEQSELAAVSTRLWQDYYTVLGRCLLQRKGKAFWNYHRTELRKIGRTLEPARLVAGTARTLAELIRHPMHWSGALRRRFFPGWA
jgi:glycosyltransferase involved in cell wall biosynthesis